MKHITHLLHIYYCTNWSDDDVIKGNIFRVTVPLWGESIVHRWIPLTKASDAELDLQTVKQAIETPANWDVIALIMTSLYWNTGRE